MEPRAVGDDVWLVFRVTKQHILLWYFILFAESEAVPSRMYLELQLFAAWYYVGISITLASDVYWFYLLRCM